jgi:hypothetical protein
VPPLKAKSEVATVNQQESEPLRSVQVEESISGNETTRSESTKTENPEITPQLSEYPIIEKSEFSEQRDPTIPTQQPQQPTYQEIQVLIDYHELREKLAEVHHKDIKNVWLSGRIESGTKKLIDMVLERLKW